MAYYGAKNSGARKGWYSQVLKPLDDLPGVRLPVSRGRWNTAATGIELAEQVGNTMRSAARSYGVRLPYPKSPMSTLSKALANVSALEDGAGIGMAQESKHQSNERMSCEQLGAEQGARPPEVGR